MAQPSVSLLDTGTSVVQLREGNDLLEKSVCGERAVPSGGATPLPSYSAWALPRGRGQKPNTGSEGHQTLFPRPLLRFLFYVCSGVAAWRGERLAGGAAGSPVESRRPEGRFSEESFGKGGIAVAEDTSGCVKAHLQSLRPGVGVGPFTAKGPHFLPCHLLRGHMLAVGMARGTSGWSNGCKFGLCTGGRFLHQQTPPILLLDKQKV